MALILNMVGAHDVFLINNPTLNFFKQSYQTFYNLSHDAYELLPLNKVDFNTKVTFEVLKRADFINKMYVNITVPQLQKSSDSTYASWVNSFANSVIEKVELDIGGVIIDTQYGLQKEINDELSKQEDNAYDLMIGKYPNRLLKYNALQQNTFSLPLSFWFNKSLGDSFPLLALKYNTIKIHVYIRPFDQCILYDGSIPPYNVGISKCSIISDYIFIDNNLRTQMLNDSIIGNGINYMITQTQLFTDIIPSNKNTYMASTLSFNHPVFELQFVFQDNVSIDNNDYFNFSKRIDNSSPIKDLKLVLDGIDLFDVMPERYFRVLQADMKHTKIPDKYIYTYSFSNKPEQFQPSGSLNLSRIDQLNIVFTMNNLVSETKLCIFGLNYNFIKIQKGYCVLLFND